MSMRAFQQARPATQYVSQCHCERSEAISFFQPLRLPRRPSWLLAMTCMETIPSPIVISSETRNPFYDPQEFTLNEKDLFPEVHTLSILILGWITQTYVATLVSDFIRLRLEMSPIKLTQPRKTRMTKPIEVTANKNTVAKTTMAIQIESGPLPRYVTN